MALHPVSLKLDRGGGGGLGLTSLQDGHSMRSLFTGAHDVPVSATWMHS